MQKHDNSVPLVSIRLPAGIENLPGFITPVLSLSSLQHLDGERKNDLELALEETLVNIFNYAYPETPGYVDLSCRVVENCLIIRIEDEGVPFSMVSAATPDLAAGILERETGGLGVHLVRSLVDDVRYRREGNRNQLELTLFLDP